MSVQAIRPDYVGEVKDRVELFHGNRLLYIGWEQHNMIAAPIALPLPPAMLFGDLIDKVLPTTAFTAHPDWPKIDWSQVEWRDSGKREARFLIGGADGHDDQARANADLLLSFGPATWPHLLARAMLAEQLFRATSLLANHPYHREG